MKTKRIVGASIYHILVFGFGLVMLYPLMWMFFSSLKETTTIFTTAGQLIPTHITFDNYANGWKGFAGITFGVFLKNSLFIAIVATFGTLMSSAFVAYSFSRCKKFKLRGILFAAMLASMMLPGQILMVPQYLWYKKLGWVGSYLPLIYYSIFFRIIFPLMRPALVTGGIFSFMWRWDDFMSALLYVNKAAQYPVSLALKLFADPGSTSDYGAMFAMAVVSLIPILIIFFIFQKQLVEGIATSGLKG